MLSQAAAGSGEPRFPVTCERARHPKSVLHKIELEHTADTKHLSQLESALFGHEINNISRIARDTSTYSPHLLTDPMRSMLELGARADEPPTSWKQFPDGVLFEFRGETSATQIIVAAVEPR